ncbi:MAG TPA: tetratricopeptide repeat protein [Lacipirellulaceae bacterium]|nr:tetratricopeptide repeat protein [Lacipirellulaceae bacterium]
MRFDVRTLKFLFVALIGAVTTAVLSVPVVGQDTVDGLSTTSTPSTNADPQKLVDKGQASLNAGDYAAALTAFAAAERAVTQPGVENALKIHIEAVVGTGRAYVGLKDYDSAEKLYRNNLGLGDDPSTVPVLNALGQLKLDMNKPDEALDQFQNALKLDPNNTDALFGYGKSLVLNGRPDEAVAPLTRAIAADPKNAEAFRLRGSAYASQYKNKQAIDDLKHAVELNPDDYEAYYTLGAIDMRREDYHDATEQFAKSIQHYKPKPGEEDQPYLQGYLSLANAHLEAGKASKDPATQKADYQASADAAKKIVQQLDEKNPLHAKALAAALYSQGIAERMLGQLGAAIHSLTKAIDLRSTSSPDDSTVGFLADAYFRRGICFHLINENKMAISDFGMAAHLDTTDLRADLWEGFTYAKLGDYHKALKAYGDAIAASDRYTPAYFNRGLTYMMLGEYDKAIDNFNDAIRLDPAHADYYLKRGIAYQQLGDNQKASESFASAIEFDKNQVAAYRHMAEVMQALGHSELADQYRQQAEKLAPQKKSQ